EQNLSAIGENLRKRGGKLPVAADLRDGSPALSGELNFVDNAVDPTTGTVQLKATFANTDRRLWPGQFVDVVLTLVDRPHSVTVPFIRRKVMTTLLMVGITGVGLLGYKALPVSDLPDVDFPTVSVTARLPGANPETMAAAVATPLEKQFSAIPGLDGMSSVS